MQRRQCAGCTRMISLTGKNPLAKQLDCQIHLGCGYHGGTCNICLCDACDKPVDPNYINHRCGCIYCSQCTQEHGLDTKTQLCPWCERPPNSGGARPYLFGIMNPSKKYGPAKLNLRKITKYGWDLHALASRPAYQAVSFIESDLSLHKLLAGEYKTLDPTNLPILNLRPIDYLRWSTKEPSKSPDVIQGLKKIGIAIQPTHIYTLAKELVDLDHQVPLLNVSSKQILNQGYTPEEISAKIAELGLSKVMSS